MALQSDASNRAPEEKPIGPLNVDPSLGGSPDDDVVAGDSEEFIDGFSWKTVIGALFIGLIMMPGAIYLSLIAGQGMGPAAEWVTIILFMEVSRRSYQTLKKQEIYLLYYVGSALTSQVGALALTGGAFATLIMTQYVVNSPVSQALGITRGVPSWVAPPPTSEALSARTFFHKDWLLPIGLLMFYQVFGRMNSWGLGYVMFRITSDVERLPFPLAPIAAEGATALAESSAQKEGWRWRIFSIGAMLGVGWGTIYILLPAVTGLVFSQPIVIVSNPFIDLTPNTQKILPAALSGLGTDIGQILVGFVLPLPVVVGSFIAAIAAHIIAPPILYNYKILHTWTPGVDLIQTQIVNNVDFWISFNIGTSIIVAVIGIGSVVGAVLKAQKNRKEGGASRLTPPPGRGDVPIWFALGLWVVGTLAYVIMCRVLVPAFPLMILLFFGFIWTPIFSYINARMAGMAGQHLSIPYVREASFVLTGDKSTAIWFAPIPLGDYGGMAQHFRTVELTRTKFVSILKVEMMMLPIMLICSFVFWSFIWRLAPIPSSNYPYASKFWPAHAQMSALWMTANRDPETNFLLKSIKPEYIGAGGLIAVISYIVIHFSGISSLFFYGLISGTHAQPAFIILQFVGAMLGHYYFAKRYGVENWRSYAPVLVAGYYCGMGLIGMGAVSLALLSKSVSRLPF